MGNPLKGLAVSSASSPVAAGSGPPGAARHTPSASAPRRGGEGPRLDGSLRSHAAPRAAENRLLAGIPADERSRLTSLLTSTTLVAGATLCGAGADVGYVYFPAGAVVSMLAIDADGRTVETASVGRDGAVGLASLVGMHRSPVWARVQRSGPALRAPAARLGEILPDCPALAERLWRFTHLLTEVASQTAVCARFHHLDRQLCRWLLATADGWGTDDLEVTHEAIAECLGMRRAGVTVALGELAAKGLVVRRRGRLRIVDRERLSEGACECYGVVRAAYGRLDASRMSDAESARLGDGRGGAV